MKRGHSQLLSVFFEVHSQQGEGEVGGGGERLGATTSIRVGGMQEPSGGGRSETWLVLEAATLRWLDQVKLSIRTGRWRSPNVAAFDF